MEAGTSAWFLGKVPLLSLLPADVRESLLQEAALDHSPRGTILYLEGDPAERVYFIIGGRVRRTRTSRDGRELTLAKYRAADWFGEQCLFDPAPREDTATVAETAILASFPRDPFLLAIADTPVLLEMVALVATRRRRLEHRLLHLVYGTVRSNLARLRLRLEQEDGFPDSGGSRVERAPTHNELASEVGATRESVTAAMISFREQGLIRPERRSLVLVDLDGLRVIASGCGTLVDD